MIGVFFSWRFVFFLTGSIVFLLLRFCTHQALPKHAETVFLGIKNIDIDRMKASYQNGKQVVWWGFSSTTNTLEAAQEFVGEVYSFYFFFSFSRSSFAVVVYPRRRTEGVNEQTKPASYNLQITQPLQTGPRAIFTIAVRNAVDIQCMSAFPNESEILVPAGTVFDVVCAVLQANDLMLIQLRESAQMPPQVK